MAADDPLRLYFGYAQAKESEATFGRLELGSTHLHRDGRTQLCLQELSFVCLEGQCVPYSTGVGLSLCEKGCGPAARRDDATP